MVPRIFKKLKLPLDTKMKFVQKMVHSPAILSVATILVIISIALLTTVELLRRRSERLRGVSPG